MAGLVSWCPDGGTRQFVRFGSVASCAFQQIAILESICEVSCCPDGGTRQFVRFGSVASCAFQQIEILESICEDRQGRIELACATAEEFSKLYYNTLDKCRHKLTKLYMEDAGLVWNGNGVAGNEDIAKFYKNLPISDTTIFSLDTQPIMAVQGRMTILVLTAGSIKFDDKATPFQQNFVLTVQDEKWKIVTDSFRFQETL